MKNKKYKICDYNHYPDVLEDFTVEGNIFETPELIKQ